jgi:hypothetical protein
LFWLGEVAFVGGRGMEGREEKQEGRREKGI